MPGHRWLRETCTPARTQGRTAFAALAVLGIVLGTATLITPANAAYYSFENQNQGGNQGNGS